MPVASDRHGRGVSKLAAGKTFADEVFGSDTGLLRLRRKSEGTFFALNFRAFKPQPYTIYTLSPEPETSSLQA